MKQTSFCEAEAKFLRILKTFKEAEEFKIVFNKLEDEILNEFKIKRTETDESN
jgi:hypothetical protein